MSRSILCVVLFVLLVAFASQYESIGQTKDKPLTINVDDIGKSVTLIGRLGKPLGTRMEIRGRWSTPEFPVKDDSPRFTVTHIDGKKIDKPVEFNIGQIEAKIRDKAANPQDAIPNYKEWDSLEGQEWTMTAYETGYFSWDDGTNQVAYYTRPFTSMIEAVVTSKKPADQK